MNSIYLFKYIHLFIYIIIYSFSKLSIYKSTNFIYLSIYLSTVNSA